MGHEKQYPEQRGFERQPDGSYMKIPKTMTVAPENALETAASMVASLSTDEAKLNKTEKARLAFLRMLAVPHLKIQAITLKLADDCRFTADFTYVDENGRLTFEDVKGFQREDAFLKIKFAARTFSMFHFLIVKKNGSGWNIDEVKP